MTDRPDPQGDAELIARLRAELREAMLALKKIEQDPRTSTKSRDIAGARAQYANETLELVAARIASNKMNEWVSEALSTSPIAEPSAMIANATSPFLGSVDGEGRIWTTCGWSEFGPAWVTEKQIPPTVGYGWVRTGKKSPFQGAMLFELIRLAATTTPQEPTVGSLSEKVARAADRGGKGSDLGPMSHAERNEALFGSQEGPSEAMIRAGTDELARWTGKNAADIDDCVAASVWHVMRSAASQGEKE